MLEIQEIQVEQPQNIVKDNRPRLTTWKGETMIRIHSIQATVKEILQVSKALDVVKVGIVGEESTGKSTLAETLAHLIHKNSEVPFAVRLFGKEELLNLEQTLAGLSPANYILIFDDVSFLEARSSKKEIDVLKETTTRIRHLPGGQDVKIILIYDYHYTKALPPYLRQSHFRYFTSVGSSEGDNMIKIVGTKYLNRIKEFQDKFVEMTTKHKCTFEIKKNKYFSYNYKNPFVSCLFFNNHTLRYVIFPKRQWIEPICSTCTEAITGLAHSIVSVKQFLEESIAKFGPGTFLSAVKVKLFLNGMNTYSNKVVQAQRYLDRALEQKLISLEEIAIEYKLEVTKARLRKKLDGVLE